MSGIGNAEETAAFWPRLGALTLDGVILWIVHLPFSPMIVLAGAIAYSGSERSTAVVAALIVAQSGTLYRIVGHGTWGRTLGKQAAGICVFRADDHGPIGYWRAIKREALFVVLALFDFGVYSIPYLAGTELGETTRHLLNLVVIVPAGGYVYADITTFFASGRNRALHDLIAGTVVVTQRSIADPSDRRDPVLVSRGL